MRFPETFFARPGAIARGRALVPKLPAGRRGIVMILRSFFRGVPTRRLCTTTLQDTPSLQGPNLWPLDECSRRELRGSV